MPMISYRCPDCGRDDEHFYHRASAAPASVQCVGFREAEERFEEIQHEVRNVDGTLTIEVELVALAPTLTPCAGTALQRETLPGERRARPARGFADIVVYEYDNWDGKSDEFKRGHQRYYVPGRNYESTEPGMKRVVLNSMHDYNRFIKRANEEITSDMRNHREMHRTYWEARRKALREDVNARVGPVRTHPLIAHLMRAMRQRSDRKTQERYGKPLDAHFHSQLLEFNQGNMQDWCDAETRWRSRRAR